jgi:hypothetical protein
MLFQQQFLHFSKYPLNAASRQLPLNVWAARLSHLTCFCSAELCDRAVVVPYGPSFQAICVPHEYQAPAHNVLITWPDHTIPYHTIPYHESTGHRMFQVMPAHLGNTGC